MGKKYLRIHHLLFLVMLLAVATGCATLSTGGDFTLESGQTFQGNLAIASGVATLKEGSRVTGDVLMTSGDLQVDGEVVGNIVISSGIVTLGSEAIVHGGIWGTSSDVRIVSGPSCPVTDAVALR